MKKDDLLIAMIRFGKKNIENGITREEMMDHLRLHKIEGAFTDPDHCSHQFERFLEQLFDHARGGVLSDKRFLKVTAYFQLLEYEELEEARSSSSRSFIVAIAAIIISFISAIASICIALFHVMDVRFIEAQSVQIEGISKVSVEGMPTVKLAGVIPIEKVKRGSVSGNKIDVTQEEFIKTNR